VTAYRTLHGDHTQECVTACHTQQRVTAHHTEHVTAHHTEHVTVHHTEDVTVHHTGTCHPGCPTPSSSGLRSTVLYDD